MRTAGSRQWTAGPLAAVLAGGLALWFPCRAAAETESPQLASYRGPVSNAVERGLAAMSARQNPDGTFARDGWGDHMAIVGLAGLAFLGAGCTPAHPIHGDAINRCVDFVVAHQRPDGMLFHGDPVHGWAYMYSHAIGTIFLTQCSGMLQPERQERVDAALARAVSLLLAAQNANKRADSQGGWRYTPTSADSDLSHTAWCLMALRAARLNGAPVPKENVDRAVNYVRRQMVGPGLPLQPLRAHAPECLHVGRGRAVHVAGRVF